MQNPAESNNSSGIYYCHYCKSKRTENQLDFLLSEEIKCLECQTIGFVEKDYEELESYENETGSGNTFYTRVSQTQSSNPFNSEHFGSDPFSSIFGVPLNTFISDLFQGSFAIPMGPTDRNVPTARIVQTGRNVPGGRGVQTGVRFPNLQSMFGGSFSFGPFTRINTSSEINPEDFARVFRTFVSDPFSSQSLNQVLEFIMQSDPNRYGSPPASKEFINNLKVHILTEETAKENESCSICTEEFRSGDKVHWLTDNKELCKHTFHVDCIIPWLQRRNSCPVCRFEVPTDDENYNNEKELLRTRITEEVQRNLNTNTNNTKNN